MKMSFVLLLLFAAPAFGESQEEIEIRVRVAIAVALANQEAPKASVVTVPQTFAEARAAAVAARKPLIVFVNQAWYDVKDCIACRQDNAAVPAQVLIGVVGPDGIMRRATLDGMPLESDILARTHSLDKELNHPAPQAQAGWSNVGSCNCQTITGRCQCVPASKCSHGGCPPVEQLQQQAKPKYTLPTTQAPTYYSVPCST